MDEGDSFTTPVFEQKRTQAAKQRKKKMAEELHGLEQQRAAVKGKLQRIVMAVQHASETNEILDEFALLTHLKTIDAAYEECNAFQNNIYALIPEEAEEQEREYIEFEKLHNQVRAVVCRMLEARKQEEPLPNPITNVTLATQPIRTNPFLHTPLPTFDGKAENWFKFKAIFTDVMSKHTGESDATKLYHLDKCLVGDAAGVINQQTINDNNFAAAWEFLIQRFEDRRKLIDIHTNGLLNLKAMTSENGKQLRELVDECTRHVEALKFHNYDLVGLSDILLVNIISSKLDLDTRKLWESSISHGEIPTYADTITFLTTRSQVLERIEPVTMRPKKIVAKLPPLKSTSFAATVEMMCNFCEKSHYNHQCDEFLKLNPKERYEKAKQVGVCYNCLRKGHITAKCSSPMSCKVCKKRHHSTLHINSTNMEGRQQRQATNESHPNSTESSITASCVTRKPCALLCTAVVYAIDASGRKQLCRILLDCGSQANLVTEKMATLLQLKRQAVKVNVIGVDGVATKVTSQTNVMLHAIQEDYSCVIECLVINKIVSSVPSSTIDVSSWPIPSGLSLADPQFNRPQKIDMLIGVGYFFGLLRSGKIKLADTLPYLQETTFGWVIGGLVGASSTEYKVINSNVATQEPQLDSLIERFWQCEEMTDSGSLSSEELNCERHFERTHIRDNTGRYVVKLPFRDNIEQLGESKQHALIRFYNLEKRMSNNSEFKEAYCKFIDEYLQLNHCKVISSKEESNFGFYLPHHAVLKPSSTTTKLRVVFDASARSSSGISLNETLMVGPTIQDPLFNIVLRFRTHPVVFTADVSKMYRMVNVHPEDTKYQRILWRKDPSEPMTTLELTTVTYGTASAPYLATKCLHQLAQDEGQSFPHAATILKNDFYVDDVLTGAESLAELFMIRTELIALLDKAGFKLHKWCSNSPEFLDSIPLELREEQLCQELNGFSKINKTLGLLWDSCNDQLMFCISFMTPGKPVTKRCVLSEIAKIFDPLGLLAPVIITAKLLMRQLWRQGLSWDEDVPKDVNLAWNRFRTGLEALSNLKIDRLAISPKTTAVELHVFSDASMEAYGSCVYVRTTYDNKVEVHLMASKSRVAPQATIPRLELCGFRLSARLAVQVEDALKINFSRKIMWTDSRIVLCWLKKSTHFLKPYVANRTAEIKALTSTYEYKHVCSNMNPADMISRGVLPEALLVNQSWWHGPAFLRQNSYCEEPYDEEDDLPELKALACASEGPVEQLSVLTKFSSIRKLQRVMAYVVRFINAIRRKGHEPCQQIYPTVSELRVAMQIIIRAVQNECFRDDIFQITQAQTSPRSSQYVGNLRTLHPFLDDDGILRVNGRIKFANVSYTRKHPAILPAKHAITALLIEAVHKENCHIGPSATLSMLRQHYWILNGRSIIRNKLQKCIHCFKVRPPNTKMFMSDLPYFRVTQAHPFQRVGIDYAGPIYVRKGLPRSPKCSKGYIALFVCMATKCVHIELVSSLTTDAFIAALTRFVARRGIPSDIYSDNATNFVGACSELHELYLLFKQQQSIDDIYKFTMPKEIHWHFIPPRSPHMGGLWEAGVKSAKCLIKRTAGDTKLTEEEWNTLLVQIEGILNSRPLIPQSADPEDYEVITPGHLLIGRPINALPEPSYDHVKVGVLSRWQHIQKMRADFWKRWSSDYLSELQQRHKWNKRFTEVKLGDLVLLKEENIPPLQWRLGRVSALHPGPDNVTRVVSIKTSSGQLKRSIAKVAVLPKENDSITIK